MGEVITISDAVEVAAPKTRREIRRTSWYAEDRTAQYLFTRSNERGKTVYFFQWKATGLRDRIFGPFDTKSKAIEGFDALLLAVTDSFCNVGVEGHITPPADLAPVSR